MALEPVNERPIFPQLIRADALGVSGWSTSMIRQLTTVFQQYGYRINQGLTAEDLTIESDANGTTIELLGLVQVCFFLETTPTTRSGTPFMSALTFPQEFGAVPLIIASRQTTGNSTGYETATSEPHALNATTTGFDWTIHETGSTFQMAYLAIGELA